MQDTTKDPVEVVSPAQNVDTQEGSAPSPSFNVFRFRKVDDNSPDFYDPVTDILNILPGAIQNSMHTMENIMFEDSDDYPLACDLAYNIHLLFQIRLIEQKDDIDIVLADFIKVFHGYPAHIRAMFTEILFSNLMVMWAVAQRRTASSNPKKILEDKTTMELGSIFTYLPDNIKKSVFIAARKELSDSVKMLKECASSEKIGFVDEANNIILDDAKQYVASVVPVKDGPRSWDTIAKILGNTELNTIKDVAAHETYPAYIKRHNDE